MIVVKATFEVAAAAAWDVLTDLDAWPEWGPTVSGSSLSGSGRRLFDGATGTVRTAVGVSLPFQVTEWVPGQRWAWKVAGVSATAHGVTPVGDSRCEVWIGVPWWAPVYAPVCRVAIGRIGRLAADRWPADPPAG